MYVQHMDCTVCQLYKKGYFLILSYFPQVGNHDAKLEELENLVKGQAELIEELKSKQVELTSALEEKQVQLDAAITDSKVQAAKELSDVKVALEQSQDQAKVSLAQNLDELTSQVQKGEELQVGLACNLEQFQELL